MSWVSIDICGDVGSKDALVDVTIFIPLAECKERAGVKFFGWCCGELWALLWVSVIGRRKSWDNIFQG